MADADFELIRQAWGALSREDIDGMLEHLDPEIDIVPFGATLAGRSYHGHQGVRDWWEQEILPSWEMFGTRPEEFRRVGERILVFGRWIATGRTSGVKLDVAATWIIDVRDGLIVRWQTYTDREEALGDVGL